MRPFRRILATALAAFGVSPGCDRSPATLPDPISTEDVIRQNATAPVGQSIKPITLSLSKHTVFVATESAPSSQPTTVKLDKLRFKTDRDNQGRMWAYAYTSQPELLRAFPQGTPYVEIAFPSFFDIINKDGNFAGIFLNSGSDCSYPIVGELFSVVSALLKQPADG